MSLSPCSPSLPRRCSQWVTLTRPHAQAIVDDVTVDAAFRQECYSPADRSRFCPSDEHYIPTLLAVRGLEAEAACEASTTYTHWEGAGGWVGACEGCRKRRGCMLLLLWDVRNWQGQPISVFANKRLHWRVLLLPLHLRLPPLAQVIFLTPRRLARLR